MIEIGVLLGQLSGSQSFEYVGSWDLSITISSLQLSTTQTHSSNFGAVVQVNSGSNGNLSYDYNSLNDLQQRWTSNVSTHSIVSYFWARTNTAQSSGAVIAYLNSEAVTIGHSNDLERYRVETLVTSQTGAILSFEVNNYSGNAFELNIDDILTSVDFVTLDSNWDFADLTNQNLVEHTTLQGRESSYLWGEFGEWRVPLNHLNSLKSSLMNEWWRSSRNLYFSYDIDDLSNMYIVKIANNSTPFTKLERPYWNYTSGNLSLQTVETNLAY